MQIIVDIDNTLWDFAAALHQKIRTYGVPEPNMWKWDFWSEYMSPEEFLRHVDDIHKAQNSDHLPFPESHEFLCALKHIGYRIVIASHRNPENYSSTEKWLNHHELVFLMSFTLA